MIWQLLFSIKNLVLYLKVMKCLFFPPGVANTFILWRSRKIKTLKPLFKSDLGAWPWVSTHPEGLLVYNFAVYCFLFFSLVPKQTPAPPPFLSTSCQFQAGGGNDTIIAPMCKSFVVSVISFVCIIKWWVKNSFFSFRMMIIFQLKVRQTSVNQVCFVFAFGH